MKVIVCVGDNNGVMFNHRRQSQDKILRERILEMTAGKILWMNSYSAKMFGACPGIAVAEDFLDKAAEVDYCFVEDAFMAGHEQSITEFILFKWNRVYPADQYFKIPSNFKLTDTQDFAGSSHEKITKEVYGLESV